LTTWEVLRRFGLGAAFLRLNIMTGRTHQIRVHLASIGCPVLGDKVYGVGLKALKKNGGPLKGLVKRQMLHARRLGLVHPVRNEFMVFEAPLPPDMTLVLETLEKAGICRT
ncbi:MAG: RluA family pseudouridine synthase, partial [Thermodesulfobacteriota bacterium]|nr:RluA family pseudouridine synthase [Thermodesulfobacteriota bacterium]